MILLKTVSFCYKNCISRFDVIYKYFLVLLVDPLLCVLLIHMMQAIVTNHLVLRGSYRSLTLIVYGNTTEDLGQFNIEFDLDNSLANVVYSPSEGKSEDLPPALCSNKLMFEESMTSLKYIGFPVAMFDIPPELKQFLLLAVKFCQVTDLENQLSEIVSTVVSPVLSYGRSDSSNNTFYWDQNMLVGVTDHKKDMEKINDVLVQARKETLELCNSKSVDSQSAEASADFERAETLISELLIDMFNKYKIFKSTSDVDLQLFSQVHPFA